MIIFRCKKIVVFFLIFAENINCEISEAVLTCTHNPYFEQK